MRPMLRTVVSAAILMLASSSHAVSGVPSPATSTLPACIRLEPGGTLGFDVIVRDIAFNPVAGSFVVLDFCPCPAVHICPEIPGGPTFPDGIACHFEGTTDATGRVHFALPGGGVCASGGMNVTADAILLGSPPVVSPDQDGDLTVNATDQALLAAKVGGSDLTGDLDCDGIVNGADVLFLDQYLERACGSSTPAQPRAWGTLKLIYR